MTTIYKVYFASFLSTIGPMTLMATDNGICFIKYGSQEKTVIEGKARLEKYLPSVQLIKDYVPMQEAIQQLDEYFKQKRHSFDLPLDLYGTSFQKQVWEALERIPYGETRSYKQIAAAVGSPKAVRAVGTANNKNPVSIFIPCHRVIGSNGKLIGYGGGLEKKEFLLRLENNR